jgi:putative aldouronate transport system permease protein
MMIKVRRLQMKTFKTSTATAGNVQMKGKSLLTRLWRQRSLQLMVIPGIIWILLFNYSPLYGLQIAFRNFKITKPITSGDWIGFENFIEFIHDYNFINILENTLGISFIKLVFGFPIPIIFALLLNELKNQRFKKFVQTISYLPHFISWVVLGGILISWMDVSGMINDLFVTVGITSEPVSYLGKPEYFWMISWLTDSWKEMGWSAIIYLASIASIDQAMYEAATVDGANRLQKIIYITLPSIKGTIALLLVLNISKMMGSNFSQIFILHNAINDSRSTTIDYYVYVMGLKAGRYSFAAAIGLFQSVANTILLLLGNKIAKKLLGRGIF